MNRFRDVHGHSATIESLRKAVRDDRLAHAIIFFGPAGIGKCAVALAFAAWQHCEEKGDDACGACGSCRQISAGSHPDVKLVRAETGKREIGVEKARDVKRFAQLAPVFGGLKVAIIDEAHRLSTAAQNALLKTLEDPPGRAAILLVSDNPDAMLTTIRSRCQRLAFQPLADDDVVAVLTESQGVDADHARRLAQLCEGSPGRALELRASLGDDGSLLQEVRAAWGARYVGLEPLAQRLGQPEAELGTKLEILLTEMRNEAVALIRSGVQPQPALRQLIDQAALVFAAAEALRRGTPNRQLLLDALLLRLSSVRA